MLFLSWRYLCFQGGKKDAGEPEKQSWGSNGRVLGSQKHPVLNLSFRKCGVYCHGGSNDILALVLLVIAIAFRKQFSL